MSCRLLYLVGQLTPGGLERQLCYLLQSMNRERYKPTVAVWNYGETDKYAQQIHALGVPLVSLSHTSRASAKLALLGRLVQQLAPEVLHSYSFYTNFAAYWATRGTRVVAMGSVRGDFTADKKNAGPWLGRLSASWPRAQICNSVAAAKTAWEAGGYCVPKRLLVVRNGLDLERFHSTPLAPGDPVCIVGVGSLVPVKRWDRLVRVALALKRRGCDGVIQIAGDGPLRRPLEQQARALGVSDYVRFLGHADDIAGLLAHATFLVHTSDSEGCPNVVMEAMACGRAVVATDVGDVPSLVEDGKTGFVVRRGDDAMLVERIVHLITDRALCCRMGEAGRAKAEQEFGLDHLVSETLAAYRAAGWKDA